VKGWSVDRLAKWLKQKGISRGLINAGGDLQVWGGFNHSEPWCVGIAHPFEEELDMAVVSLFDGAAATSNIVGRSWQSDEGMMHHLIDPRTMRPCNSDVMQCTVTGPSAVECEIWAKVVCILGSSAAIPLLLRNIPHCDALF
ncbi:FAD:protein FMN transferase, partial [Frankia sp. Cpl3]|nr:FAD:protein FMN transferase [Frankia sp. Cpl3]